MNKSKCFPIFGIFLCIFLSFLSCFTCLLLKKLHSCLHALERPLLYLETDHGSSLGMTSFYLAFPKTQGFSVEYKPCFQSDFMTQVFVIFSKYFTQWLNLLPEITYAVTCNTHHKLAGRFFRK